MHSMLHSHVTRLVRQSLKISKWCGHFLHTLEMGVTDFLAGRKQTKQIQQAKEGGASGNTGIWAPWHEELMVVSSGGGAASSASGWLAVGHSCTA